MSWECLKQLDAQLQIFTVQMHCSCHVVSCELLFISGLRKLEAFFAFLITVMALSFGYEVHTWRYFAELN